MHMFLANADSGSQSLSNMQLILAQSGALAGIAIIACVPMVISRRRRARRAGAILALAFFWAIFAAASVLPLISAEFTWSAEEQQMIYSGYYDPSQHPAPALPWPFWIGLAVAGAALIVWAAKDAQTPAFAPDEQHKGNGDAYS